MSRVPAPLVVPLEPLAPVETMGTRGPEYPRSQSRRHPICLGTGRFPVTETHTPRARTGKSWTPEPESGSQARVPCWWSREQWIQAVFQDLTTETGAGALSRHRTCAARVHAVSTADANTADTTTGRNVRTSHATVAKKLGCSVDTVRRARRVLRDLGWAVEITRGRYMTQAERILASLHKDTYQNRFASNRSLTIPTRAIAVHPYPEGVKKSSPKTSRVVPSARSRGAGTGKLQPKKNHAARPSVSLGIQKLTARLVRRLPWLDRRDQHLMGLCRSLSQCGVTEEWTVQDLMNALETDHRTRGLLTLPPNSQRNPRALFLTQVRRAITGLEPPARARHRAVEARRAARAQELCDRARSAETKTSMPSWFRDALAEAINTDPPGIFSTTAPTGTPNIIAPTGTGSTVVPNVHNAPDRSNGHIVPKVANSADMTTDGPLVRGSDAGADDCPASNRRRRTGPATTYRDHLRTTPRDGSADPAQPLSGHERVASNGGDQPPEQTLFS